MQDEFERAFMVFREDHQREMQARMAEYAARAAETEARLAQATRDTEALRKELEERIYALEFSIRSQVSDATALVRSAHDISQRAERTARMLEQRTASEREPIAKANAALQALVGITARLESLERATDFRAPDVAGLIREVETRLAAVEARSARAEHPQSPLGLQAGEWSPTAAGTTKRAR